MVMMSSHYAFPADLSKATWQAALVAELGPKLASERHLEVTWSQPVASICSMNFLVLAYAEKVSMALGGRRVFPNGEPYTTPSLQGPWTARPWVELSRWQRLKVRLDLLRGHPRMPAARIHEK